MSKEYGDRELELGEGQVYFQPATTNERDALRRFETAVLERDIIEAVLAAIYHCETDFAGDILLEAFNRIEGSNRLYLGNITETFLGMHRTDYRVDDFIKEMKKKCTDEIDMTDNIKGAEEYRKMYAGSSSTTE